MTRSLFALCAVLSFSALFAQNTNQPADKLCTDPSVQHPKAIAQRSAEYSDIARKLRAMGGVVELNILITAEGGVKDIQVTKSLGYGLDEKAIKAVLAWRFDSAARDGHPLACRDLVEVNFRWGAARIPANWYSGRMGFALGDEVAPPLVLDGSMPEVGEDFKDETVTLEFSVDIKGAVRNVKKVKGSDAGYELLSPHLAEWKFRPAMDGGRVVEATGRIIFIKGSASQAMNAQLFDGTGLSQVAAGPEPVLALTKEALVGRYQREPALNKWHHGVIEWNDTKTSLQWRNDAGDSWPLAPDLRNGILRADGNPFYDDYPEIGRAFLIRLREGTVSTVEGFEFLGDFYVRSSDGAAQSGSDTREVVEKAARETSIQQVRPSANSDDDKAIIDEARNSILASAETLSNLKAEEVIARYSSDNGGKGAWKKDDEVTVTVTYADGKEQYSDVRVNGKRSSSPVQNLPGSWATGNFVTMVANLLNPSTKAIFRRRGEDRVGGRLSLMFEYTVGLDSSSWDLHTPSRSYRTAFEGSIWIDKDSHSVVRMQMRATGLPRDFSIGSVETTLEYGFVSLDRDTFRLLPVSSIVASCQGGAKGSCTRNETKFQNFRNIN